MPACLKLIFYSMKKILLLFLLMVVFSGGLMAQEAESAVGGSKFYVGAKGAYGIVDYESIIATTTDFSEITYDNISYGLVFGFNITGNLGLQVEGNYSQYGANKIIETYVYSPGSPVLQSYGEFSLVDHVNMDLYYVDIPLLIKYTVSEIGFSPYFYVGANWGINILGNTTIVRKISETEEIYRDYKDDISDRIRYNEFAPVGGLGFRMNMGSLSILGDVRYKHGFQNLSNVDNGLGYTNRALWVSVGLVFNL
jgi:hypothetical protein